MSRKLTTEQVKQAHAIYMKNQSLSKTAKRVSKDFGQKISRHLLSSVFKAHGLFVFPPNGQPIVHREPTIVSGDVSLIVAMVSLAWDDYRNYANSSGNLGSRIEATSAAAFICGPLYTKVMREWLPIKASPSTLPNGVDPQHLLSCAEEYNIGYDYWKKGHTD